MRILITGASGFIGTNYLDYCLARGDEVVNIDIKLPAKRGHEQYFKQCDIMDYNLLEKIFCDFRPSHVVHLAAKTDAHFISDLADFKPIWRA